MISHHELVAGFEQASVAFVPIGTWVYTYRAFSVGPETFERVEVLERVPPNESLRIHSVHTTVRNGDGPRCPMDGNPGHVGLSIVMLTAALWEAQLESGPPDWRPAHMTPEDHYTESE